VALNTITPYLTLIIIWYSIGFIQNRDPIYRVELSKYSSLWDGKVKDNQLPSHDEVDEGEA